MSEEIKSPLAVTADVKLKVIYCAGHAIATYGTNNKGLIDTVTLDIDNLLTVAPEHTDDALKFMAESWLKYQANNNAKDGSVKKLTKRIASLGGYLASPSKTGMAKQLESIKEQMLAAASSGDKAKAKELKKQYIELMTANLPDIDEDED